MAYFSRLTDIVTCNLTKLLDESEDRSVALAAIIREMEDGLAGANRSMQTARGNEDRIAAELQEHGHQVAYWAEKARAELKANNEPQARLALVRKREAESLVAGLQQQFQAAVSTREHLATTHRALEARLSDARRRHDERHRASAPNAGADAEFQSSLTAEIEDELEALKRELGQS